MKFAKLSELLMETPIGRFETVGDWSPSAPSRGYDKASEKLLTNPAYVEKVKLKWSKADQYFDLYFVKMKGNSKFSEIGEVMPDFVKDTMKLNIPQRGDRITVIFVNNVGDEKVPLTAWIIAHRFAHALTKKHQSVQDFTGDKNVRNSDYEQIDQTVDRMVNWVSKYVYGERTDDTWMYSQQGADVPLKKRKIMETLGTFKSAREGNLRQDFEMVNELIAQYIITGKVTLNKKLPKMIPLKKAWGRPSRSLYKKQTQDHINDEYIEDQINDFELQIAGYIEEALMNAEGRVFVM